MRLARLVDDLLDLSRIEAGAAAPQRDWTDLHDVVASAAVPLGGDHPIEFALPSDLPLIRADAAQLERVFSNLIENAVKFSPPGSPVKVTGSATPASVTVRITDQGPGISKQERARVFEPFFRGRGARGAGSGLGLAISRGFVDANGGRIVLQTGTGPWDLVCGQLPGRPPARRRGPGRTARRGRSAAMTTSGPRVLVVDDEPQIVRGLKIVLRSAGYAVEAAFETKEQALALLATRPPDALVLDLVLPDGRGSDICREVRQWSKLPILMLSAVGDEREKVRALDAGADDYVTKPFGTDELLARLRAIMRRSGEGAGEPELKIGDVVIDLADRRVDRAGERVHLTPIEFDLLRVLASHQGRLITHRQLLREVWGPEYGEETHYLRVHVAHIRSKLEPDPSRPQYLITEPGVGYRLMDPSP